MSDKKNTITACLVVYNEEPIIERCLLSIKGLADEIIVIHDGECADQTLEIAKKYTDNIFVRDHIGMMEGHLVFAYNQASGDWLLRIDADEYFDNNDILKIKNLINNNDDIDGIKFDWEMWDGIKSVYFEGLQKIVLFRKNKYSYCGIPHEAGRVGGKIIKTGIVLHHRPVYNNISWSNFLKKKNKWAPIHAKYFFPESIKIECFNTDLSGWLKGSKLIRKNIVVSLIFYPLKNFLGQLRNGLWKSWIGFNVALQQYIYYFSLYLEIWKIQRKSKLR